MSETHYVVSVTGTLTTPFTDDDAARLVSGFPGWVSLTHKADANTLTVDIPADDNPHDQIDTCKALVLDATQDILGAPLEDVTAVVHEEQEVAF